MDEFETELNEFEFRPSVFEWEGLDFHVDDLIAIKAGAKQKVYKIAKISNFCRAFNFQTEKNDRNSISLEELNRGL